MKEFGAIKRNFHLDHFDCLKRENNRYYVMTQQ